MQLTTAQLQAIKAWVVANNNSLFDQSSVNLLNAITPDSYKVWRTALNKHDLLEQTDLDSAAAVTTFALGGGTGSFIDRSQGERDGWSELWNSILACKPSLALVRVAFFDIFSGAAALAAQNRKHFWARGQRPARVWEKLLVAATVGGPVHSATSGNNPTGQTGTRGSWTNPDTLGTAADGTPAEGLITLDIVISSEAS